MENKTLERAGISYAAMATLISFLSTILVIGVFQWFGKTLGKELTVTASVFTYCFALMATHCGFSKLRFTGGLLVAGESLGITAALSIFFSPLAPQEILLMAFVLGSVSYFSSFVRIARLKKQGYVEK